MVIEHLSVLYRNSVWKIVAARFRSTLFVQLSD